MLPSFVSRLESPDGQFRIRRVQAKDIKSAQKIIEQRELNRASYSLLDRKPLQQVTTRRHADGVHATINLDVFAGSGLGGRDLLEFVERDHHVEADGTAYGPDKFLKSHLQAHYQRDPYKIVSLEPDIPNVAQIIEALKQLQQHEEAWEKALKEMEDSGVAMGAVTAFLFGLTAQHMIDGSAPIVWTSATIKNALTTNSWTPNQDTHDYFNDVTNEVTGTNYIAGGATLTSPTSTYDTATNQIRLDSTDTSWTTSTIANARRSVIWNDTAGASSTDPVMGWIDFGADVSTTAGTFLITYDSTGVIVYTVA